MCLGSRKKYGLTAEVPFLIDLGKLGDDTEFPHSLKRP